MRAIRRVIVHCTATAAGRDIGAAEIRAWHVAGRGWRDIGYHYVVRLDGTVEAGRPLGEAGAHVAGQNADSIGVAYVGGLGADGAPKDTRTEAQRRALAALIAELQARFPGVTVTGHRDWAATDCPGFDAARFALDGCGAWGRAAHG